MQSANNENIIIPEAKTDSKELIDGSADKPNATVKPDSSTETEAIIDDPNQERLNNIPDFKKYNIDPTLRIGETFDYTTSCYNDRSLSTTGQMRITSYTKSVMTDEILEFLDEESTEIEGYEVLKLDISGTFGDKNALDYGVLPIQCTENYYEIKIFTDSKVEKSGLNEQTYNRYVINYNGRSAYVYSWKTGGWEPVDTSSGSLKYNIQLTFLVPSGFDGIVCGFQNAANFVPDAYIYDNYDADQYRLFRLN